MTTAIDLELQAGSVAGPLKYERLYIVLGYLKSQVKLEEFRLLYDFVQLQLAKHRIALSTDSHSSIFSAGIAALSGRLEDIREMAREYAAGLRDPKRR